MHPIQLCKAARNKSRIGNCGLIPLSKVARYLLYRAINNTGDHLDSLAAAPWHAHEHRPNIKSKAGSVVGIDPVAPPKRVQDFMSGTLDKLAQLFSHRRRCSSLSPERQTRLPR